MLECFCWSFKKLCKEAIENKNEIWCLKGSFLHSHRSFWTWPFCAIFSLLFHQLHFWSSSQSWKFCSMHALFCPTWQIQGHLDKDRSQLHQWQWFNLSLQKCDLSQEGACTIIKAIFQWLFCFFESLFWSKLGWGMENGNWFFETCWNSWTSTRFWSLINDAWLVLFCVCRLFCKVCSKIFKASQGSFWESICAGIQSKNDNRFVVCNVLLCPKQGTTQSILVWNSHPEFSLGTDTPQCHRTSWC